MAEVFRGIAIADGGFQKPVAIKRILPGLCEDQRFVKLLIAEAKLLSQLRHRNIVQIFDVGLNDDHQYFLVMEYVDGTNLATIQRHLEHTGKRMPFDLALHIGAEIADALAHAHAAKGVDEKPMGLVHRDVSPSNILVSLAGEVKLTDFGIAKRGGDITGHGGVRGKYAYNSPEQAVNRPLDGRSDIYSTAVVVHELIVGQPLYSHLNDLDAMHAVLGDDPPLLTLLDPTLPHAIDTVIDAALARDPSRRPANAAAFSAQLRNIRYSLDEAAGDPATELGRIVQAALLDTGAARRKPRATSAPPRAAAEPFSTGFDGKETTVVFVRTAGSFGADDLESTSLREAQSIVDEFDEQFAKLALMPSPPTFTEVGMESLPAHSSGFEAEDETTNVTEKTDDGVAAFLFEDSVVKPIPPVAAVVDTLPLPILDKPPASSATVVATRPATVTTPNPPMPRAPSIAPLAKAAPPIAPLAKAAPPIAPLAKAAPPVMKPAHRVAIGVGAIALVALGFGGTRLLQSHRDGNVVATPTTPHVDAVPLPVAVAVVAPTQVIDAAMPPIDAAPAIDAALVVLPDAAPAPAPPKKLPPRRKPIKLAPPVSRPKLDHPRPLTD